MYIAGVIYPKVRAIPTAQRGWLLLVATLGFGMTNAEMTYTVGCNADSWSNPTDLGL